MTPMASSRLAHVVAPLLLTSCALLCADASVHDYTGERFVGSGNAFVLHGGSEGVYATSKAGAFIRCVWTGAGGSIQCFSGLSGR